MKLIFLFFVQVLLLVAAQGQPQVKVKDGKLEGTTLTSRAGREYSAFLSVPYGSAKRFQAPTPPTKWDGVKKAATRGEECAQCMWFSNKPQGVEDCLTLNVYTPKLNGNFPVMVYFHGGGFTIGTANYYGADLLLDEDVVLVTVNYRLGPLGFLSMQDDLLPGNNGLRDQNLALRWVQDNIKSFGGNPGSVTIFGGSAGSASTTYQVLSPQSKGLFHGAIFQSGSALNPWSTSRNPKEMAKRLAKAAGCPTCCSKKIYDCLVAKSADDLLNAMGPLVQFGYDPFTPFGPVIEHDHPNAFIKEEPLVSMETGNFNQVPVIAGLVEDEGILMHSAYIFDNPKLLEDLNTKWEEIFPVTFLYDEVYHNFTSQATKEISKKLRKYYFENRDIDESLRQELTDAYSDRFFSLGVRKQVVTLAKHVPVYPYIFAHNRGDYSITKFFGIDEIFGVTHADELSYLFSKALDIAPDFEKGSEAEQVSKYIVKIWTSFAKDKSPTSLYGSQQQWKPISKAQIEGKAPLRYYRLDSDTSLQLEPFTERVEFWERILAEASSQSAAEAKRDEL